MKFENRQEQRWVCERINSLLAPLMYHLCEQDQEVVKIVLQIINDTGIESEET